MFQCKTYVGRVHYYEPHTESGQDSIYKKALFSESTGIHRLTPKDAQDDARLLGKERTGREADNV